MSNTEQIAVAASAMLSYVCERKSASGQSPEFLQRDETSPLQNLLRECPVDQRRSHEIDDEMRTSRLQLCTC